MSRLPWPRFRFRGQRPPWIIISLVTAPSILLLILLVLHLLPALPFNTLIVSLPTPAPNQDRPPLQLSSDPYTNADSQHHTEVEPDSYAYGSTIVATFQAGRYEDGGSSNIGWATSTDNGNDWKNGFLTGITQVAHGPFTRASDPSVTYDAAHKTWLIVALTQVGDGPTLASHTIVASPSTDGGLTWGQPSYIVNGGSTFFDKPWIACDNTSTSPFYGHCYVEWDDNDKIGLILMSTSLDGGHTWGKPQTTADQARGTGGQPLVQPNGNVIVPISGYDDHDMLSFLSTNGGKSWNHTIIVANIPHAIFPSAAMDATGKVYMVWSDCEFETNCPTTGGEEDSAGNQKAGDMVLLQPAPAPPSPGDDLVMSTSTDGLTWSPVQIVPLDPLASGIDHILPGLAVDPTTSGANARLALSYYYHAANCTIDCPYYFGFVSSTDGGANWSQRITLAGPMWLTWLPAGRNKVGDYSTTSFVQGLAFPIFAIAHAPDGGNFDEGMYTISGGLTIG